MATLDSDALFQALLKGSACSLCLVASDNTIVAVNPEWERGAGLPARDLVGRDFFAAFPESKVLANLFAGRARPGVRIDVPCVRQQKGDEEIWWEASVLALDPAIGARFLVSARDITLRVRAEKERERIFNQLSAANEALTETSLRLQEQARTMERHAAQLSALLDSLAEGVTIADPAGNILLMNDVARQFYRLPDGSAIASVDDLAQLDVRKPNDATLTFARLPLVRALRGERFADYEVVVGTRDGAAHLSCTGSAVRDDQGNVVLAIEVAHDVTALRRLEDRRAEYIAMISHDLRAPLTVINVRAEWLRGVLAKRALADGVRGAESILKSGRRMNAMLQDLVESARLEAGAFRLLKQPVELTQFVAEVVERFAVQEDRLCVAVEAAGPLMLQIDPDRFERALVNLISNALKYSPPGAKVIVSAGYQPSEAVVAVADNGPGIPVDQQGRLFQRFSRLSGGRSADGFGLGLYITRLIVEAHGGRVAVESEPGRGSTFRIHLPIDR